MKKLLKVGKQIKFINGQMVEYEILPLVDPYDPILRKPTIPIDFDTMPGGKISYIGMSLIESCEFYEGLGLAANQIGLEYCACAVADLSNNQILCLINPTIVEMSAETSDIKEGCLSFPGLFLKIGRPNSVTIDFQAFNGEKVRRTFDGIMATCVMHEIDHLRGICYTDRVSPITLEKERRKVKANLKKIQRAVTEGIQMTPAAPKTKKKSKKTSQVIDNQ